MEHRRRQPQDVPDRGLGVEALAFAIADNGQKEIQGHGLMGQAMEISSMKELAINDGIDAGLPHKDGF